MLVALPWYILGINGKLKFAEFIQVFTKNEIN